MGQQLTAGEICKHKVTVGYRQTTLVAAAQLMRDLGCPRETIGTEDVIRIEPSLAPVRHKIVGGDFTATDESGDVYKFTTGLAGKCAEAGVQFRFNHLVTRLLTEGTGAAARIAGDLARELRRR